MSFMQLFPRVTVPHLNGYGRDDRLGPDAAAAAIIRSSTQTPVGRHHGVRREGPSVAVAVERRRYIRGAFAGPLEDLRRGLM